MNKKDYLAPLAEQFEMSTEENILLSGSASVTNSGENMDIDDEWDLY